MMAYQSKKFSAILRYCEYSISCLVVNMSCLSVNSFDFAGDKMQERCSTKSNELTDHASLFYMINNIVKNVDE